MPLPFSERVSVRFSTTLLANVARAGLSFGSGLLIARALGAREYGNFTFLVGSFTAVTQLLDMGTGAAFFTLISQRRREAKIMTAYMVWMAAQFVAATLIVGVILPQSFVDRIWLGHQRTMLLLAFAASFLINQVWGLVIQLGEAIRRTVVIQSVAVLQALLHFGLVTLAWYSNQLTVRVVMWLLIAEYVTLAAIAGPMLVRLNLEARKPGETDELLRNVLRTIYLYSRPLAVYAWVGFLYTFADQWMLQRFGGASQQGFFAIGQQFAYVSLIATTSMLRVFWKEVAEASDRGDDEGTHRLYVRTTRGLYFLGAWISCLFIPYTRDILERTVGSSYRGAWLSMALMFFYPIHQALGQIQGTLLQATGETKSYAVIGLCLMGLSIPVSYLVLARPDNAIPGLGLGAVGLASKLVLLQIIGVNVQGYVIARKRGWPFEYGFQAVALGTLLGVAAVSRVVAAGIVPLGAALYLALTIAILWRFPSLAGVDSAQLQATIRGPLVALRAMRAKHS